MTIAAILQNKGRRVISLPRGTKLRDAVALLSENGIGAMPVLEEGKVAGMLSERDIIQCLDKDGAAALDRDVEAAMTSPAITVVGEMPVLAALSMMSQRRIRHLPVVEHGEVIGIVSIGDLVKHRIDQIEREAEAMRSYIQSA
jgi:CBS domain-containing protein